MDNFKTQENIGRNYLRVFLKDRPDLKFINDRYSPYDAETNKSLIEIKVRDCNSNQYPDFILEEHKVIEMMKASQTKNLYYVNFFKDGKVAFWNIRNIIKNYKVEERLCKRTTAIDKGYRNKRVYMLKLKDSKLYEYNKI